MILPVARYPPIPPHEPAPSSPWLDGFFAAVTGSKGAPIEPCRLPGMLFILFSIFTVLIFTSTHYLYLNDA